MLARKMGSRIFLYLSKMKAYFFPTKVSPASSKVSPAPSPEASLMEGLFGQHGVLVSTADYSKDDIRDIALHYPYRARAECALDVCTMFSGGDYFEFGSDGMGTFRNFLTAFDIFNLPATLPDTKFYAFDIFGKIDKQKDFSEYAENYFNGWKDEGSDKLQQAHNYVSNHNIMVEGCHIIQGYFEDTLSDEFKANRLKDGRKIGFAFLDCNITPSYELAFDFIAGQMAEMSFIYMDEYFINNDVPGLYRKFAEKLLKDHGLQSYYMRNAGGFGALFRIMPIGVAD